jgi:chromosome segregation ATPase
MSELFEQISALIDDSERDLGRIERTLTDGYAEALSLEMERSRLQKQIAQVIEGIEHGDAALNAKELSTLAQRLDGKAGELSKLRSALGTLRRHARAVR